MAGDPARIGPFRLVARLGRGGMGRVYLGRSESTGRTVAVKTIHGELLVDPEFRTRFSQEVAAARRVRDEYIAEVVDADPDGQTPWLATAYAPGISVEDAVRRFGPLPADSVRVLGVCIARAVAAIHAVGLVHRDLKPGNVLLTAAGPKVIDFGIARGVSDATLTKTGMVSGSPPYMAPEQLTVGSFGPGSDVFSLGAILHYAATAAGPYGRGGAQEQYVRAMAIGPQADPALPDILADVVDRCFTADPGSRPSAPDLVRALETRAGERPAPGWLPNAVVADILAQATDALNKDSAAGFAQQPQDATPFAPPAQQPSMPQRQSPISAPSRSQVPAQQQPRQQQQPFAPLTPPLPYMRPPTPPQPQPVAQPHALRPNVPHPSTPRSGTGAPHPPPQSYPGGSYQGAPPRGNQYPPQRYPAQGAPTGGAYPAQYAGQNAGQSSVPAVPYGYGRPPVASDNGQAVTALVLALVGIVVPCLQPVALVFGFVGLSKSKQTGVGHGQALAATIISGFFVSLYVLLVIFLIAVV
ncbi:MAG: protein kinase domain-containing protein [Actinocrinis sp.]